jgi:hypothetical protein
VIRFLVLPFILSMGCSKPIATAAPEEINIADYHGFSLDAAWTYRDDGVLDEAPEDSSLLRARYTGDGVVDMRRGVRWADAARTAEVVFHLDNNFSILAWTLGPYSGDVDLPLGNEIPLDGQSVQVSGWFCRTERRVEIETYYAFFEDVVQFQCEGEGGPEGNWTFAKELGLVAYEGPEYSLSLVAPW